MIDHQSKFYSFSGPDPFSGAQAASSGYRIFSGSFTGQTCALALTASIHAPANAIRGGHTYPAIPPAEPQCYGLADAIESGCELFLTNDDQLSNFPDITVEKLP